MLQAFSNLPFFMPFFLMDSDCQYGFQIFERAVYESKSRLDNISFTYPVLIDPLISFEELFEDRPPFVTLEKQQRNVANLMIAFDKITAIKIMTDSEPSIEL